MPRGMYTYLPFGRILENSTLEVWTNCAIRRKPRTDWSHLSVPPNQLLSHTPISLQIFLPRISFLPFLDLCSYFFGVISQSLLTNYYPTHLFLCAFNLDFSLSHFWGIFYHFRSLLPLFGGIFSHFWGLNTIHQSRPPNYTPVLIWNFQNSWLIVHHFKLHLWEYEYSNL